MPSSSVRAPKARTIVPERACRQWRNRARQENNLFRFGNLGPVKSAARYGF